LAGFGWISCDFANPGRKKDIELDFQLQPRTAPDKSLLPMKVQFINEVV